MLIYKVLRSYEMLALERDGKTRGAQVDVEDGYVHFSTAAELPETLRRHFAGETGLHLLAIDGNAVADDLRWEPARGGTLFPHLYRQLRRTDVLWSCPLADGPDGPVAPDDLT